MINFSNVEKLLSNAESNKGLSDVDKERLKNSWEKIDSNIKVELSDEQIECFIAIIYIIGDRKFSSYIEQINSWHIDVMLISLDNIFKKTGIFYKAYRVFLDEIKNYFPDSVKVKPRKIHKMKSLADWLHNSVKGETLEIVKITDLNKTILGLKDTKSSEVFVVGNMHDLTFTLEGNE